MTTQLDQLAEHPHWPHRACRDNTDPNTFFIRDDEPWQHARTRLEATARHYCAPCPIQRACRQAGRAAGGWGLWGGVAYRTNGSGRTTATDLLNTQREGDQG